MIEYCDISEHDLKLLLKGGDDEYNIHFYTDSGTEVVIRKGVCDNLLEGKDEI